METSKKRLEDYLLLVQIIEILVDRLLTGGEGLYQLSEHQCCCNSILVPNVRAKHVSNSLFITERHFIALLYEVQCDISDVFETSYLYKNEKFILFWSQLTCEAFHKFKPFDVAHSFDHLRAHGRRDHR